MKDYLYVNEIFYSIQGESSYQGFPTVFVRLSGCNLRCPYCDTKYAISRSTGKRRLIKNVVEDIMQYNAHYICFTGGEPLMQQEGILQVVNSLFCYYDPKISIETNGTIAPIPAFDNIVKMVYDFKLPCAFVNLRKYQKYKAAFKELIIPRTLPDDEVKYVIENLVEADQIYEIYDLILKEPGDSPIQVVSPVWTKWKKNDLKMLVEVLKVRIPMAKLQFQMHKQIWPVNKRGV